jgi:hypothetical protein
MSVKAEVPEGLAKPGSVAQGSEVVGAIAKPKPLVQAKHKPISALAGVKSFILCDSLGC